MAFKQDVRLLLKFLMKYDIYNEFINVMGCLDRISSDKRIELFYLFMYLASYYDPSGMLDTDKSKYIEYNAAIDRLTYKFKKENKGSHLPLKSVWVNFFINTNIERIKKEWLDFLDDPNTPGCRLDKYMGWGHTYPGLCCETVEDLEKSMESLPMYISTYDVNIKLEDGRFFKYVPYIEV